MSGTQIDTLTKRVRDLTIWLAENAPTVADEQRHLDAGTPERAYWHYGYLVAIRDVLKLIAN